MIAFYGEIAALITALCWAFNSIMFSNAGKRVGSLTVNRIRLWIAFIILAIIHFFLFNSLFPFQIELKGIIYLVISGIIGFAAGDAFLFEALVLIGPRLAMLMMTLVPIFSTLIAWVFLGEYLIFKQILAIIITTVGIGWVVSERESKKSKLIIDKRKYLLGLFFGVLGALGQSVGLLLSKIGMKGNVSAISATYLRIIGALVIMTIASLIMGKLGDDIKKMKDKIALFQITSGTAIGPVLGVIFSLIAITNTYLGIAATLMSLAPVILLPVSYFYYKEKITLRTVVGTIIALVGASWLFFI